MLHAELDVVLLLGAPGAGKGTQAQFLAETLRVPHVASGDLLREHRRLGTPLGQSAKAYMDRGDLVPDALVVNMVMDRLARPDAATGVLLDGFPRTLTQAEALDTSLLGLTRGVDLAVYLHVPQRVLVDRLAGRWTCPVCQATYHEIFNPSPAGADCGRCGAALQQRPDDRREVVETRVAVYLRETAPVIEHYRTLGVLAEVDGSQDIPGVQADLACLVTRRCGASANLLTSTPSVVTAPARA